MRQGSCLAVLSWQVRSRCLATITKVVHYASADMLREQLKDVTISSFIAGLLATKDGTTTVAAVRLAELLMSKLPEVQAGLAAGPVLMLA